MQNLPITQNLTDRQIIEICKGNFYKNFAGKYSAYIYENQAIDTLFSVHKEFIINKTAYEITDKTIHQQVGFRSTFILEHIYLKYPKAIAPYYKEIFTLFSIVTNPSIMRSYGKIVSQILRKNQYQATQEERVAIAEVCVQWIITPEIRSAVKIGAIEILLLLKKEVEFIPLILPDMMEMLALNATPAICVRLRKWKEQLK